jgi:hypothetical protein
MPSLSIIHVFSSIILLEGLNFYFFVWDMVVDNVIPFNDFRTLDVEEIVIANFHRMFREYAPSIPFSNTVVLANTKGK